MNERVVSLKEVLAEIDAMPPVKAEGHDFIEKTCLKTRIELLPSAQPEYKPVTAEDFAKTMSRNTLYSFMRWHSEALKLMEGHGFVICKKTI